MPPSGSTFTDWQQVDEETALFVDEDFSWSEIPTRRRHRASAVAQPVSRASSGRLLRGDGPGVASEYVRVQSSPVRVQPESVRVQSSPVRVQPEPVRAATEENRNGYAQSHVELAEAEFEEARRRWSASYGDPGAEAFDRDDAASYANARVVEDRSGALDLRHSGRRTVVITGRGDSRYTLAPARRRSSELRFHERSGFNPDRTAMWAVLLGIALLIGCIAH